MKRLLAGALAVIAIGCATPASLKDRRPGV